MVVKAEDRFKISVGFPSSLKKHYRLFKIVSFWYIMVSGIMKRQGGFLSQRDAILTLKVQRMFFQFQYFSFKSQRDSDQALLRRSFSVLKNSAGVKL